VYSGWFEALTALGVRVEHYNLNDRLVFYASACLPTGNTDDGGQLEFKRAMSREAATAAAANGVLSAAYQFWPDVVLIVMGALMPAHLLQVMRDRGHKVVILHTESPYQDEEQLLKAQFASLNLLNDPVNIDSYRRLGMPAEYMPHAYRPGIHNLGPGSADLESDFCFVGTGFPSRIEYFTAMRDAGGFDGVDVALCGNWQALPADSPLRPLMSHDIEHCIDNELAARIYRSSRAGINIYRREAEDAHRGEGWALGPREVEMAACGLFFLRESRGEADQVLPMLPAVTGPGDAAEQLHWWLGHDQQRDAAAAGARAAVRGRTFDANARRLLHLVSKLS
jgi:spore maturation protein CgeB